MDDFFERPHRRHVKELNLVPVIDMFTTVVFFLLLSTEFMAFTKLTLPPAQVDIITKQPETPPLSPQIFVGDMGNSVKIQLTWGGTQPGELSEKVQNTGDDQMQEQLRQKTLKIVQQFAAKNPKEKSIRLTLLSNTPYQQLISTMDGIRETIPDVVLTSYMEAEAKFRGAAN
ncbi:MAG: biopolymer transporter ExbD [Oligoflexia bacterium]|nr:biopolymer transporter ExbD [Oligoflexia bacterium]